MQVGTAQETVTVEGVAVAVQSDSSEISQVVTGQQISQLATNGRSIYNFINLTPGSSSLQGDFQAPTPVGGDANVSFNGNRPSHNIYLMDGGENLDRGGAGTFSVMPSVEALAEFRTLSSNYDAEYGLSSAATMTTVVKSGANAFHGSAWEYVRNDALDARNYFNPRPNKVAKLRFNTFGFNLSGPIWKNKTFFFYNMEWRRLIQGQTLNQTVPYTDTYGGDFTSHLPADVLDKTGADNGLPIPHSGLHVPCANQLSPALQTLFTNAGQTFSTPDESGSCKPNASALIAQNPVFQPFTIGESTGMIPAALLEANAQTLLNTGKIFPGPTNGAKFQGGNSVPTNVREEIIRIDHKFNDKFSIFGHFVDESILQSFGTTMWSGDNVPTIGNTFGNPSYSAVVHLIQTVSPRLLNEVAFNYNGNRINIIPQAHFGAPLASPIDLNRILGGDNALSRMPTINLSAQTGAQYSANWTPWINKADSYQIRDDISWTKGAHQLKIGASWLLYKKVQDIFASTQGNFNFNGFYSGNDFADFLLGYANSYAEDAIHDNGRWNNVSWAAYIQDNWRATKRLTLNLGLRWDGVPHTYEAGHRTSNFYPSLYQPETVDDVFLPDGTINPANSHVGPSPNSKLSGLLFYLNGIGIDGVGGTPKGLVDNHWATFGPRLGFAYDVTGQGKTVIRGGFGTMYERVQGNDMYNAGGNVPFSSAASFNNVLLSDPHNGVLGGTVSVPLVAAGITGLARNNYKLPVSYQFSIGVQQSVGAKSVLSVAYVGTQNRHQSDWREINLPDPSLLPGLVASNGSGLNQVVPYLGFRGIRLANNEGNAHYNSLQTSLRGKLKNDLDFQFGYTYSKSIDPTTGGGNGFDLDNVTNPYVGWKYDVGPSIFDRTNVAFINFVYDIPLLRNSPNRVLKAAVGGWQVSGILNFESGAPLNITLGGTNAGSVIANSNNRPDLTGKISYPHKANQWFDTTAFTAPACVTGADCWGNLGHDALRGPGRNNWNMTVFKKFAFTERVGLEFRADAFNVWNHTQFIGNVQQGGISTSTTASDFGKVTSAHDPRTLQLGMKLVF
jgi:hypothetical protein